jgi:hypothetical protein
MLCPTAATPARELPAAAPSCDNACIACWISASVIFLAYKYSYINYL